MKIIKTDNFDRELYADELVLTGVNEYYGVMIVDMLNKKLSGDDANWFYKLVADDHKLFEGFQP